MVAIMNLTGRCVKLFTKETVPMNQLTSAISDEIVLETATKQNRIVITFDSDFGELNF